MDRKLDEIDKMILDILKENSKIKTVDIARRLMIPANTIYARLRRIEKEGFIKRYTIELDYERLGKTIVAYVFVRISQKTSTGKKITQFDIAEKIKEIENVENVSIITGPYDILVRIRVSDIKELNDVVIRKLRSIDGVEKTQTTIVLQEINND